MNCKVCEHSKRKQIDGLIARGQTDLAVATRFDLPRGSVGRHRRLHLDAVRVPSAEVTPHVPSDALAQLQADLDAHVKVEPHDYRVTAETARAILAHLRTRARVEHGRGIQMLDILAHSKWHALFFGRVMTFLEEKHPAAHDDMARTYLALLVEAITEYEAPKVPVALADLVATLRAEADAAPRGRPRSAVSSALASAESAQERYRRARSGAS
jgi:hypothetical protein